MQTNLGRHDFHVSTAMSGSEALEAYARVRPDLVLLDLGLPDMDGLDVIRVVSENGPPPRSSCCRRAKRERDKVTALDLGADDYLTKPFGMNELLARVRVALRTRRTWSAGPTTVTRFGDLRTGPGATPRHLAGVEVHLTPTEWDLIKFFATHPDKALTDRMITDAIWGASYPAQAHSLHVYVGRLRKKLQTTPGTQRHILTEPGVGYRFVTDDDA